MKCKNSVWLALLAALLGTAPMARGAGFEAWYAVLMEKQPVGWAHMTETVEGDRIRSRSVMEISMRRGPVALKIQSEEWFLETRSGNPIEAYSKMNLGLMAQEQRVRFKPDGMELVSEQGGQEQVKQLPLPTASWMPPAAAHRHVEQKLQEGAREIRYATLQISSGLQPMEITARRLGEEPVEVLGKTVPAIVWEQTTSLFPGMKIRVYLDAQGRELKTDLPLMPGMNLTLVAADEALAKAKVNPPEVLAATLVKPDKPIDRPRTLARGTFELRTPEGTPAPALPETGAQRVLSREGNRVRVQVQRDARRPEPNPGKDYLASSPMLNTQDPEVIALARKALESGEKQSAMEKADRLRGFVRSHLEHKDLAVGFATASEVARTRQGDCTEHAVLLAALLRVAGIPSRTVSGIVYVEEFVGQRHVFGYHMWTQAWIEGAGWIDFDAALGDERFDATHIALATSPLSETGMMNDLVNMVPLLGQLAIVVLEP